MISLPLDCRSVAGTNLRRPANVEANRSVRVIPALALVSWSLRERGTAARERDGFSPCHSVVLLPRHVLEGIALSHRISNQNGILVYGIAFNAAIKLVATYHCADRNSNFAPVCTLVNWSCPCVAGKEHALLICNHRSDIDWLVGWVISQVHLYPGSPISSFQTAMSHQESMTSELLL